jgi:hypothetical protein
MPPSPAGKGGGRTPLNRLVTRIVRVARLAQRPGRVVRVEAARHGPAERSVLIFDPADRGRFVAGEVPAGRGTRVRSV